MISGLGVGKLDPEVPGVGLPRPPYLADYVLEGFGARIFRHLAESDEGNAQCAGGIEELWVELGNVVDDTNVLRGENMDLREELSDLQSRFDVLQLRMEEMRLQTEINYQETLRLKQDSAEQRDGHEALLGMVRANRLVADETDDRLAPETQRGDEHHRQLEEIQQFLRNMGLATSPGSRVSSLR